MQKDQKHLCADNCSKNKFIDITCTRRRNFGQARRWFKVYCGSFETAHEARLIKVSSSYVRSSPKKWICRDSLPKPKTKKPALSGRAGFGVEKGRDPVTLNIKDIHTHTHTHKKKTAPY